MSKRLFERVVIVGPGLIGGSLGMALRGGALVGTVTGVGRRQASLEKALAAGAIDEATLDVGGAIGQGDLVVLATRVGHIVAQVPVLVPRMRRGAILTDVGSVKGAICDAARAAIGRCGDGGVRFVGGHPLAGSEQRGIDAARADLFDDTVCVVTPEEATDSGGSALALLREMWEGVGCRVCELTPAGHDRLLAQVSHLPHVAAAALINCVSEEAFAFAARGFTDTTRIASGDPALWVDICLANRDALLPALRGMQGRLGEFVGALESGDAAGLSRFLTAAQERRDRKSANGG